MNLKRALRNLDMPSQTTQELLDALRDEARKSEKPLWMNALDRYGLAVIGWVFVGFIVWHWGGKWFDAKLADDKADREIRQADQQQMGMFLKAQTESLQALVEQEPQERAFETKVIAVHEEQTAVLQGIKTDTAGTLSEIAKCKEDMHAVPAQRAEEIVLLKEIRDNLKVKDGM